jgi:ATP-dependent Clp protease ATP-binding subunit ClpA
MFGRRSSAEEMRFSEAAQRALSFAREEAARLGHDQVGTEHQLLGLLRADEGPVTDLLDRLAAPPGALRDWLESRIPPGPAIGVAADRLLLATQAKQAIEHAMSEARQLRDSVIRPDHLLLGLLREGSGEAAAILVEHGITLNRARAALRALRVPGAPDVFQIRIDTSGASIYDQIIARVQEAVATGELQPGDRLPPVRGLADRLGVAHRNLGRAYW